MAAREPDPWMLGAWCENQAHQTFISKADPYVLPLLANPHHGGQLRKVTGDRRRTSVQLVPCLDEPFVHTDCVLDCTSLQTWTDPLLMYNHLKLALEYKKKTRMTENDGIKEG